MIYKTLGNTNAKVSIVGLGTARLPEYQINGEWHLDEKVVLPILETAINLGVNYFDTGFGYCHGTAQRTIGEYMKPYRKGIYLSSKVMPTDVECADDLKRLLERNLEDLNTDYVDFFSFWGISKKITEEKILRLNLLKTVEQLKDEGVINHIGFSFHDSPEALPYIVNECGIMEMALCQYNILDRTNEEVMKWAKEHGIGVLVMSPLAGGNLVMPDEYIMKRTGASANITYREALKYVYANPSVSCVLSGVQNSGMLQENIELACSEQPLSSKEVESLTVLVDDLKQYSDLFCTGCNYCQPCPQNINISRYFKQYNLANVYGLTKTASDDYLYFIENNNARISQCINCGQCVKKCPQNINIPLKLKRVEAFFRAISRCYSR